MEVESCGETPRGSLVAVVTPQSQDGTKSGKSIKDRERGDMEMRRIIDFQEMIFCQMMIKKLGSSC